MKILVYQLDEQKFFKASSRRFINVTKILISENCIFWHHFYKLSIWKSAITNIVTFNRRTSDPLIEKKRKKYQNVIQCGNLDITNLHITEFSV